MTVHFKHLDELEQTYVGQHHEHSSFEEPLSYVPCSDHVEADYLFLILNSVNINNR